MTMDSNAVMTSTKIQRWVDARRPPYIEPAVTVLVTVAASVGGYFLFPSSYDRLVLSGVLVNVVLALSLILVTEAGRISLAQASLAGVGAYFSGYLALTLSWNPFVAIVIGAVAATVAGVVIGGLALRLQGFYFAVASIAFSQIFLIVVSGWQSVTGGLAGLTGIPSLPNWSIAGLHMHYGFSIDLAGYYGTALALVVLTLVVVYLLTGKTSVGRRIRAVGVDDVLARSVGVSAAFWRTFAFSIGAFLAGLAGGLQASFLGGAAPSSYDTFSSVIILAMVFIGGRRSVPGAVVGALILTVVPEILRFSGGQAELIFDGVLFLAVAFVFPTGLVPTVSRLSRRLLSRGVATPGGRSAHQHPANGGNSGDE